MLKTSGKKCPPVQLGTTVPEVDRGCGDVLNILAVVLQKTDNELYQLGIRQGVVKTLYSRRQLTVCQQQLGIQEYALKSLQEYAVRTLVNKRENIPVSYGINQTTQSKQVKAFVKPEDLRPYPKCSQTEQTRKRRSQKSEILTSTPLKDELEAKQFELTKRLKEKLVQ
ncbi:hypothetical protein MML48_9g00004756 [Holotrichia oblita]|uniref:Uncharacterized protein n=1 Tax=Holotrichia oblita TaxID=644536 RepID=A0ACB9SNP9_HOLOL|nr:hypothetical protein MML48_9g00004756 [Holotrichia oblita]